MLYLILLYYTIKVQLNTNVVLKIKYLGAERPNLEALLVRNAPKILLMLL